MESVNGCRGFTLKLLSLVCKVSSPYGHTAEAQFLKKKLGFWNNSEVRIANEIR
jgi:hypothetical protein